MWIFEFSLGVCSTKRYDLVYSLGYLVSNGRQVLLRDIRLGGSTTDCLSNALLANPSWLAVVRNSFKDVDGD